MGKELLSAAIAMLLGGASAVAGAQNKAYLQGRTLDANGKERLFFKAGEPIIFEIRFQGAAEAPDGAFIKWTRTGDDDDSNDRQGQVAASQNPVRIETALDRPGFVRLQARLVNKDGKPCFQNPGRNFDGGAGVEPEKLRGVDEPTDFDSFWARQKKRLADMPLEVRRKELPSEWGKVYAVEIDCPSVRPVTGYLTIPPNASREHPVLCSLNTHGYGFNVPHKPPLKADRSGVNLTINAHGVRLPAFGADDDYYKALRWEIRNKNGYGGYYDYACDPDQNADPVTAYFNGMALRVLRALQYLRTLPEWNGKDLWVCGGSQGGLQAIWAAGLDGYVTYAIAPVVWSCDMGGTTFGRNRGDWYVKWTERSKNGLGYYDPVNVAKRIPKTCRVNIERAGLGDYVSPPSGLAVLYNNIPGPKKIVWVQGSTHGFVPAYGCQKETWSKDWSSQ
ncbi:MAG TPA: acetylxylan esterase [Verrucomicrobia bacterium]|nr:acetylxylan esterase [Verrucomicrobiota bacterium]